ncbi:hypothetical protein GLAREA_03922 [Glarea lozoyensis ATCC 20868]|uniref:Uncharacterized protein n=2 Tax=Glarea lozoyensis TaxID=101852 RepID=S3CZB9_GLAL2|nr:uncharacterized protein GLAREA_03922 [Glarea lozoyensis ATCC 20868]EHL03025.1 hypothetical protein M7I_0997 [Glarea lozoyensis 74030]EPE30955.1 hypothetical protein GLAREA_03922 [Glarea lozoyensis ATCC 20868]
MQFSNFLSIAAIFTLAAATPVAEPAASPKVASPSPLALHQRQASNAGVELCTDAGFTGRCVHIVQPIGQCIALSSDLNDLVSSVGPDQNAGDCRFFFDFGCSDSNGFRHFDTRFPGISDLSKVSGANDAISSYQCFGPGS